MDNYDVAIVVPIYNAGGVLNRCIESLTAQTYRDIIIVLVDDGSKDDSGKICDEWQAKDSRIKVIHQANQGSIAARKNGLYCEEAQKAEFIAFCDADDAYELNAIEKLVENSKKYNADCVCGQIQKIRGKFKYVSKRDCFQIEKPQFLDRDEVMGRIYLSCLGLVDYPVSYYGKIYRTSIISKAFEFNPVVHFMGDDLNFQIHLLPMLSSLVLLPDVIYNYFDGGITSRFMPYAFDDFLALYSLKENRANEFFKGEALKEAYHFMNNEMMWCTLSRFTDCFVMGKYKKKQMQQEIVRVSEIDIVKKAAKYVATEDHALHDFAKNILCKEYKKIWRFVRKDSIKKRTRKFVKKILLKVTKK